MQVLGLFGNIAAAQSLPVLPKDFGSGKSVVVLGAGIAGLTAAYELEQAGYTVHLLEARSRVGGRSWTVRDGDRIVMNGEADQVARFSEGAYFNAGPARIPSFHERLLGYCGKLGVPLEVEINSSRGAYIMGGDGRKQRMRVAINDTRGHIAELLTKAVNQGALDQSLTPEDKAALLPFLKTYGDLDEQGGFKGTLRSGFKTYPDAGVRSFAAPPEAVPLRDLLANEQLPATLFEDNVYMQATMFQPVGGMDWIAAGFQRALKRPVILNADVQRVRNGDRKVEVAFKDTRTGAMRSLSADYMVCTIPFPVLAKVDCDFAPPVAQAIKNVVYDHSNKVAFDAPRFWEKEQIFGGISFVGGDTSLVWYPSAGLFSPRGMLLACYSSGERAARFAQLPIAEQVERARAVVEKLHPGHGGECANGVAVNWNKIPYSLGPWPNWYAGMAGRQEGMIDTDPYRLLNQPAGRVIFAGAALSQTPGWQEGAIQSAHGAVADLANLQRADAVTQPTRIAA
ncbi:flavin monoamine oxidase family protein [Sphingomonas sp. S1-29]|uniref:flavin monoamine oxidase family protein n=1 Tax=Sphingomonas sp. S1-29 TaxID=2991074 RepID=UPI002240C542|nr:flavin monoamine oxidase family protein [Sphingomonas sp. S1-29]UZK70100.1 flavin monoamine oxidase family protein [Sphingomonas sp. S1-29]